LATRPALPALTAYGLQEFTDMSQVAFVDPALLDRIASYLEMQQLNDGSWLLDRYNLSTDSAEQRVVSTAYVVWGMADSGHADSVAVQRGLDYLEQALTEAAAPPPAAGVERLPENREQKGDAPTDRPSYPPPSQPASLGDQPLSTYALALVANAFVAAGEDATPLLEELLARSDVDEQGARYWTGGAATYYGGYGDAVTIETTALVAQALLRADYAPEAAAAAIAYIGAQRDGRGGYFTTQATVQALKALILAAEGEDTQGSATITVTVTQADGATSTRTVTVDDINEDLTQQLVFDAVADGAAVTITVDGERAPRYQLVTDYYLPWGAVTDTDGDAPVRVDVRYDRSEIEVNETVGVQAVVDVLHAQRSDMLLVAVGLPPGFTPVSAGLERLVSQDRIDRYELIGNRIVFYLSGLSDGDRLTLPYELQARYVVRAQTPSGEAYNYYAPDQASDVAPQRIVVTLAVP
jgi:hypothetical protein